MESNSGLRGENPVMALPLPLPTRVFQLQFIYYILPSVYPFDSSQYTVAGLEPLETDLHHHILFLKDLF